MNIRASDGSQIMTVDELINKLEFKIFPVFRVSDSETITKLSSFLSTVNFLDVMFISSNPALISEANQKFAVGRGVIDYTEKYADKASLTAEECMAIRAEMKINNAYVALFPAALCDKDTVQYLYDRQVAVWCATTAEPTVEEQYAALLSGAVGVVSDATNELLEIACALPENTMTRLPLNIGHRGITSLAPENTIEGYLLVVEKGVDVVEIDIYMTKDKQLVVFHDETTGRLWNKDLDVKTSTLAELQALSLNASTAAKYPDFKDAKIPSFEETLQAIKDTGVQMFVEIKSADYSIPAAVRDLVKKYDMEDRCSVITFSGAQLQKMAEVWPEMSGGLLRLESYDGITNDAPVEGLIQAFGVIGPLGATLNPQHLTQFKGNVIREALLRGVLVYPYTYVNNGYGDAFVWGYSGLTGDTPEVMGNYTKTFSVSNLTDGMSVTAGEALTLEAIATKYNGETADVSSKSTLSVVMVSGEGVALENGAITFANEGEVKLMVTFTDKVGISRATYVTDIITVTVTAAEEITPPEESDTSETDTNEPETNEPETNEPEASEPEASEPESSEPVVDETASSTEPEGSDAESSSDTSTVGGVDTSAVTATLDSEPAADSGCASILSASALLIMAMAAVCFKKKKD